MNPLIENKRFQLYLKGGFLCLYDKMVEFSRLIFMPEAVKIFEIYYDSEIFKEYLKHED